MVAAWKGQMGGRPQHGSQGAGGDSRPTRPLSRPSWVARPPGIGSSRRPSPRFLRTVHAGDTPWDRQDQKKRDKEPRGPRLRGVLQGRAVHALPFAARGLGHALPQRGDRLRHREAGPRPRQDPGRCRSQGEQARAPRCREAARRFQDAVSPRRRLGAAPTSTTAGPEKPLEDAVDQMLRGGIERTRIWTRS